jgi:hypothetical protein
MVWRWTREALIDCCVRVILNGGKTVMMDWQVVQGICRRLFLMYFHSFNLEILCKITETYQKVQSVTRHSGSGLSE